MKPLTPRQADVLAFINNTIVTKGRSPTIREISAAFGIKSNNGVNDHLRALLRKGAIVKDPMIARGIRVVGENVPVVGDQDAVERIASWIENSVKNAEWLAFAIRNGAWR